MRIRTKFNVKTQMIEEKKLDKLISFLIRGVVFLLPLFFLPWSNSMLGLDNFHKQLFIFLFLPLIFILTLYRKTKDEDFEFDLTKNFIGMKIMLAVFFISSLLSVDKFSSFFGGFDFIGLPFLSLLSFMFFYFSLVDYFKKKENIYKVLRVFIYSNLLIIVFLLFYIFNIGSEVFKKMLGTYEDVSVYLSFVSIMFAALLLNKEIFKSVLGRMYARGLLRYFFLASIYVIISINFSPAWWIILIGSILIGISMLIEHGKKYKKLILFPLILFLLSSFFLMVNNYQDPSITKNKFIKARIASYEDSFDILKGSLKDNFLFGTGPETFSNAYSLYRDQALNDSKYWSIRFDRSASFMMTLLITSGFLGFLSYIFIFLAALFYIFKNYKNKDLGNRSFVYLFVFPLLVLSLAVQFIYTVNYILIFIYWLFLALAFSTASGAKVFRINQDKKKLKEAVVFYVALLVIGWIFLIGYQAKFTFAKYFHNRGTYDMKNTSESDLLASVRLNPFRYDYYGAISRHYKNIALSNDLGKQENLDKALYFAYEGMLRSKKSVKANESIASVYKLTSEYNEEDLVLVISYFNRALELEPTNPVLMTELGKTYFEVKEIDMAIKYFKMSIEAKKENFETKLYLAKAYIAKEEFNEALATLKEIEMTRNPEVHFYMGSIYYNLGDTEKALEKYSQVLSISPLNSNAMYGMAVIYEEAEDIEKALHYFRKIKELNLDNDEINKRIAELEKK